MAVWYGHIRRYLRRIPFDILVEVIIIAPAKQGAPDIRIRVATDAGRIGTIVGRQAAISYIGISNLINAIETRRVAIVEILAAFVPQRGDNAVSKHVPNKAVIVGPTEQSDGVSNIVAVVWRPIAVQAEKEIAERQAVSGTAPVPVRAVHLADIALIEIQ